MQIEVASFTANGSTVTIPVSRAEDVEDVREYDVNEC